MSSKADEAGHTKASGTWRSWFLGIILAAALVGAVLHFGEIENFARLVARADPLWFAVAILFQLSTYASVAAGWAAVLRRAGTPRWLPRLMRIALTKLFADQAMPSAGMGGNVLLVDQLVRLRVPRGTAVAALLVSMIGYYAAFAFFATAMLVLLWLHDKATPLMAGLVTTFLLMALAIPSLALWLRHRGSQPLSPRLEHLAVVRTLLEIVGQAPADLIGDRQLLVRVTGFNGWIFLADAATLWACLHAFPSETASQMRWSRWRSVIPSAARRQPQCVTNSPAVEICRPIPLRRMQSLTPRCGAVCSGLVGAVSVGRSPIW